MTVSTVTTFLVARKRIERKSEVLNSELFVLGPRDARQYSQRIPHGARVVRAQNRVEPQIHVRTQVHVGQRAGRQPGFEANCEFASCPSPANGLAIPDPLCGGMCCRERGIGFPEPLATTIPARIRTLPKRFAKRFSPSLLKVRLSMDLTTSPRLRLLVLCALRIRESNLFGDPNLGLCEPGFRKGLAELVRVLRVYTYRSA